MAIDPETRLTTTQAEKNGPQRAIRGLRWLLVCIAIFSCNFLYGLDNTIVADIQAPIIESFGEVGKLGWLGIGFPLGSIAIILPIGKAYALFDIKWLFVGSLAMFAAGSALCGAAPNMDALIVGRVWAGAGGAGMYLGNLNLIQIMTTPQERSIYMSLVVLVYGAGAILGPVIGGSLADSSRSGWRWAFYLNLFIFVAITPIYIFLLPSHQPRPNEKLLKKIRPLDWVGIVLSTASYTTFAIIFTFGGTSWAWGDGRMIALYVVCLGVFGAFILTQRFSLFTTPANRIFPGQFLRSRTLVLMFISSACLGGALFVSIYYIPLYFQFVRNDNGTGAAVRLLPFICFYVFGVLLNGVFMIRFGYYMPWYLVSGILTTVGGALMYTSTVETEPGKIYGYSILIGIGMIAYQAAYSIVPSKVEPGQIADVIQFINVAQQGSILIALTVCSTVFQNTAYDRLISILGSAGYSSTDIQAAIAGARSVVLQSAPPDLKKAALEVLVEAINYTYTLIIVSGGLLIVCAIMMRRERIAMELGVGG